MKLIVKTSDGQTVERVVNSNKVTVGRSNKCDVVVPDDGVSRSHCIIEIEAGNLFVTDSGSANGVYVDGNRIPSDTRTPFNSYNQLSLGSLECVVLDTDEVATNPNMKIANLGQSEPTSATRMISRPTKSGPPKKAQAKSSVSLGLLAPIILLVGVGYYFFNSTPPETEVNTKAVTDSSTSEPEYKKRAKVSKTIPDEFFLPSEYEQLNTTKTCNAMEVVCQNLQLDSSQYEGVAQNKGDTVVFINPAAHFSQERYQAMKEASDINDLITFDLILGSELLNNFYTGQVPQIHLVINDASGKNLKVFRFHPLKFVPGAAPRLKLMEDLNRAFQEKNSETFWKTLGDIVPVKSLSV